MGTSSLRRGAQLLAMRDDIEVKWVRGNIDTRIKKMESGEYDAIIREFNEIAERAFLKRMDGSCQVPIGGYAAYEDGELYLTGLIMPEDGSEQYIVKKSHMRWSASVQRIS